jgi:hypothetical protein
MSKSIIFFIDLKREKPIKTKNQILADIEIEPKLHGLLIDKPNFYLTAPC